MRGEKSRLISRVLRFFPEFTLLEHTPTDGAGKWQSVANWDYRLCHINPQSK